MTLEPRQEAHSRRLAVCAQESSWAMHVFLAYRTAEVGNNRTVVVNEIHVRPEPATAIEPATCGLRNCERGIAQVFEDMGNPLIIVDGRELRQSVSIRFDLA